MKTRAEIALKNNHHQVCRRRPAEKWARQCGELGERLLSFESSIAAYHPKHSRVRQLLLTWLGLEPALLDRLLDLGLRYLSVLVDDRGRAFVHVEVHGLHALRLRQRLFDDHRAGGAIHSWHLHLGSNLLGHHSASYQT